MPHLLRSEDRRLKQKLLSSCRILFRCNCFFLGCVTMDSKDDAIARNFLRFTLASRPHRVLTQRVLGKLKGNVLDFFKTYGKGWYEAWMRSTSPTATSTPQGLLALTIYIDPGCLFRKKVLSTNTDGKPYCVLEFFSVFGDAWYDYWQRSRSYTARYDKESPKAPHQAPRSFSSSE